MLYGRQIAWHFSSVCHGINQPTYPNGDSMGIQKDTMA